MHKKILIFLIIVISSNIVSGQQLIILKFSSEEQIDSIKIENLMIDDSNHPEDYQGPAIFADFNPQMTDETFREKFPYVKTREVILRNVTTASGKTLRVSDNLFMFKDVKVDIE